MEIKEVKRLKLELEQQILKLSRDFEEKSATYIESLNVVRASSIDKTEVAYIKIDCHI